MLLAILSPRYDELGERVAGWMIANLWDERQGCFCFQRTPRGVNRIPYMRWSQAWAWHGLTAWAARPAGAGAKREGCVATQPLNC